MDDKVTAAVGAHFVTPIALDEKGKLNEHGTSQS